MSHQLSERNILVIAFLGILAIAAGFFYYKRYSQFRNIPVEVTASPHMDVDASNAHSIDLEMMSAEAISFKYGLDESDTIPKPTEAYQSGPLIAENIQVFK
jgi:hypothetical protein